MRLERMTETGYDVLAVLLPALITVVKDINEPRLPSLKGKLQARKAEIKVWSAADLDVEEEKLGLDGSPTQVIKIFTPPARKGGEILKGEPQEIAVKLAQVVKEIKSGG